MEKQYPLLEVKENRRKAVKRNTSMKIKSDHLCYFLKKESPTQQDKFLLVWTPWGGG